jgi:hypothetical protein
VEFVCVCGLSPYIILIRSSGGSLVMAIKQLNIHFARSPYFTFYKNNLLLLKLHISLRYKGKGKVVPVL